MTTPQLSFETQRKAFVLSERSFSVRLQNLENLKQLIEDNEKAILNALREDLGKPAIESRLAETLNVLHEIKWFKKKLRTLMKPKKVSSSLLFWPVKSYIFSEPKGQVLIISPWNYPFQLLMSPLVGALAAGNTAVLKPSEMAHQTSKLVAELVPNYFPATEVCVVEGGVPETTELLAQVFDHIFYTGNESIGKIVMKAAAENLTPVTLELGGKSPAVIALKRSKNLETICQRIVWAKFYNAGQTCVAPDYLLVPEDKKAEVITCLKKKIDSFYPEKKRASSSDYGRVINDRHFHRLDKLIESSHIICGGKRDACSRFIEPTLVEADFNSEVMKEEIFGPILPILSYRDFQQALEEVKNRPKPLAAYFYGDDESLKEEFIHEVSCGGMVINDAIIHLANNSLPFGGVGPSGMGSYHGAYSFQTFSHFKPVVKRSLAFENRLRYPPYGRFKGWLLSLLFKIFG